MSSRRRSKIKPFPEARYSSAFSSRILVKDFVCCLPELQIISCEATKKIPFLKNCNTVTVTQKSFLETVILLYCNAWCELALSKKQEQSSRNLFFLSENCNTASHKNWKSWCQWPVPVTSRMMPPCCWISTTRNSVAKNSLPRFSWKRKRLLWAGATIVAAGLVVGSGGCPIFHAVVGHFYMGVNASEEKYIIICIKVCRVV